MGEEWLPVSRRRVDRLEAENARLREAVARHLRDQGRRIDENAALRATLLAVRLHSLLEIRRAAFAPEIGVRYTEAIRGDICEQIRRLEEFVDAALDLNEQGEGGMAKPASERCRWRYEQSEGE